MARFYAMSIGRERLGAPIARPLMLHSGWVFLAGGILFLMIGGGFLLFAMYRSLVLGQEVDWQGFAYMVTAMGGATAAILGVVIPLLRDRRIQRVEEIRAGVPPQSPLAPSDASPTGGLVNNEAIR